MVRLQIKSTENSFPLDLLSFSGTDGNKFLLKSSQNENITISIKYPLQVEQKFSFEDFKCQAFSSPVLSNEDHIFEVSTSHNNIGRIGWIFPIQSLVSNLHKQAANKHFLQYAFVTFQNLLLGNYFEKDIVIQCDSFESELTLQDIYPTNLIVLSLSNNKTKLIPNFSVENYLHSLYGYTYFHCASFSDIADIELNTKQTSITKILINPLSPTLNDEIFIKSLYKDHLKKRNHPLVQFLLLYQIVELLLEKVYDSEVYELISLTKSRTKTPHELSKKINQIITEESRFKSLCNKYLSTPLHSTVSIIDVCNKILTHFNKEKTDVVEAIYQVRNIIVHNYRGVTDIKGHSSLLLEVNFEFEKFLEHILTHYIDGVENLHYDSSSIAWLSYKLLQEKK